MYIVPLPNTVHVVYAQRMGAGSQWQESGDWLTARQDNTIVYWCLPSVEHSTCDYINNETIQ